MRRFRPPTPRHCAVRRGPGRGALARHVDLALLEVPAGGHARARPAPAAGRDAAQRGAAAEADEAVTAGGGDRWRAGPRRRPLAAGYWPAAAGDWRLRWTTYC